MAEQAKGTRTVELTIADRKRRFDIDDPKLPDWIDANELSAADYPYGEKLDRDIYRDRLEALQRQLVRLQTDMQRTGKRMIIVFEGRDAAGKGGTIKRLRAYLNPRNMRVVALPKPSDRERGQWYFQRYVDHFPTLGEMVAFDRSWYNRAGVEPVMGFCTPAQHGRFLADTPEFERIIVDEGIVFYKFWLNIGRETQLKRFHDRRHSPLKHWKLSGIDIVGMEKWDDYTTARDQMIAATHRSHAPWTVVRFNDKRRGRLEVLRHVLAGVDYDGKDETIIGEADPKIVGEGPDFLPQGGD
ncbi:MULTISPECIES: polyphosphate kinase 2 [unclassified Roseitalea]|uniref:polyphosphate kinase 2 n=1 Tax=unclassified Roseitalea TaxID=2639107 RepID=UPI00273E51E3|nr:MULTISPECIES: polyphosphate kinase 2 [unclassified Roseitalea]